MKSLIQISENDNRIWIKTKKITNQLALQNIMYYMSIEKQTNHTSLSRIYCQGNLGILQKHKSLNLSYLFIHLRRHVSFYPWLTLLLLMMQQLTEFFHVFGENLCSKEYKTFYLNFSFFSILQRFHWFHWFLWFLWFHWFQKKEANLKEASFLAPFCPDI